MKKLPAPTYDDCAFAAKQCRTRSEFIRRFHRHYMAARKNGWIDDVCGHMEIYFKYAAWTQAEFLEEAKRFSSRAEFQKGSSGAYQAAKRFGVLEKICVHMGAPRVRRSYWNLETLGSEAARYNTRASFKRGSLYAYRRATQLGVMDRICGHMVTFANHLRGRKQVYIIREKNSKRAYIGITVDIELRYRQHSQGGCRPVREILSSPHATKILAHGLRPREAATLERRFINRFRAKGWDLANQRGGGSLGAGAIIIWTREAVLAKALEYKTRSEFAKNAGAAYRVARCGGYLDVACAHMPTRVKRNGKPWPKPWDLAAEVNLELTQLREANRVEKCPLCGRA